MFSRVFRSLRQVSTQVEFRPEIGVVCNTLSNLMEIRLVRPDKLNSLNTSMFEKISSFLQQNLMGDLPLKRILWVSGSGRAFCAGGDIAHMMNDLKKSRDAEREKPLTNIPESCAYFFKLEYETDFLVSSLKSKYGIYQISVWDGIVMGGGVGLSIHGFARIATENTLFAMPETAIGFFPDVGMTHVLGNLQVDRSLCQLAEKSQVQKALGRYIGLTGVRLKARDTLLAGLATHVVPSARIAELKAGISNFHRCSADLGSDLLAYLSDFHSLEGLEPSLLEENLPEIMAVFGEDSVSVRDIFAKLRESSTPWALATLKLLDKASPLSLVITLRVLEAHRSLDLKTTFQKEYRLSQSFMSDQSDFVEGVSCVLLERGRKPNWRLELEKVSSQVVDPFFGCLPSNHPQGDLFQSPCP